MSIEEIKKALEGVTPDRVERLWWFLHILAKSSGSTNADDDMWNWINAFCSDFEDDTFNRAATIGFIKVSHDSFMETSKAQMTPSGFAFINYFEQAPSASLLSTLESLQRENEALKKDRDFWKEQFQVETRYRIELADRGTLLALTDANSRAEAAEAEVKRLREALHKIESGYGANDICARIAHSALSAQVQDVAERGYSLDKMKAAYIAGYAQGNCLSGTLEGDEEWEEYFSCVVDTASPAPAPKHGDEE